VLNGPGLGTDGWVPAADCGGCHPAQHAAWARSRHAAAWTNPVFQAGFAAEPLPFCVHCHAPAARQAAELLPLLPAARPAGPGAMPAPLPGGPAAAEGVSCVVCHLRDGAILSPRPLRGGAAPHPVRAEPTMATSAFCAGCHEFPAPAAHGPGRPAALTDALMQSTASEWRAWAADRPGAPPCQGCHMPGADHALPAGAHDRAALRAALSATLRPGPDGPTLVLESVGVGHDLPTGDLFRSLTVEVRPADGPWRELHRFGRAFTTVEDPDGRPLARLPLGSTALRPGLPVALPLPRGAAAWRVVYHYGGDHDEARGWLPEAALREVLAEGGVG
jgi:hypothetical protein